MSIQVASLLIIGTFDSWQGDAYQLNRQGRELLAHHRYQESLRVFRRAADRAVVDLGPGDPATAMILRNLALAYIEAGDAAEAEAPAVLALSIFEAKFGPQDVGLSPILNVLAECYASTGRLQAAERAEQRAISIGADARAHYGTALHNLGAIYELSGDPVGAAAWYFRAITVKTEMLGASHPYVALSKAALKRVERQERLAVAPRHAIRLEQAAE